MFNKSKKITIRLLGGLGNQLHCYAFGCAIAAKTNRRLEVDADSGFWGDPYRREYLLDAFPNFDGIRKKVPASWLGRKVFQIFVKVFGRFGQGLPNSWKPVIYEKRPIRYQQELHSNRFFRSVYFVGNWASYRYYDGIADKLRSELVPPRPTELAALVILEKISRGESCSIHWRSYSEEIGTDYPSLIGYYIQAIERMSRMHPGIKFYVFSDIPDAVRKLLCDIDVDLFFVDIPVASGNRQSLIDFYLMYRCKHSIIGDSSFSWWAAWLGDSENKTVFAPLGFSPLGNDWVPPEWIILKY